MKFRNATTQPMQRNLSVLCASILILNSCGKNPQMQSSLPQAPITQGVIYGEDGRHDLYNEKNAAYLNLARSTAMQISRSALSEKEGGVVSIQSHSYAEELKLCPEEAFANQNVAGECSGSLVAQDVILTAGHCVPSARDCEAISYVFDYALTSPTTDLTEVSKKNVYHCASILHRALEENGTDYAIIKLDRPVEGRQALSVRSSGRPSVGDNIMVIGNPWGLPTKIEAGGKVRALHEALFEASLDTYRGNSGSAVFNPQSGLIEGILVQGETDFVKDPLRGCTRSNLCKEDECMGEQIVYAETFAKLLSK